MDTLMTLIDDVKHIIPEGKYLAMCIAIKEAYDNTNTNTHSSTDEMTPEDRDLEERIFIEIITEDVIEKLKMLKEKYHLKKNRKMVVYHSYNTHKYTDMPCAIKFNGDDAKKTQWDGLWYVDDAYSEDITLYIRYNVEQPDNSTLTIKINRAECLEFTGMNIKFKNM